VFLASEKFGRIVRGETDIVSELLEPALELLWNSVEDVFEWLKRAEGTIERVCSQIFKVCQSMNPPNRVFNLN